MLRSMNELEIKPLTPFGIQINGTNRPPTQVSADLIDQLLRREKLILLRGFAPLERGAFLDYALRHLGKKLLEWDFGPVMEMKEAPDPKNYLFSSQRVPFHWDGAFHRVPSHLLFKCVEAPTLGAGGETLFCNTEAIWNDANASEHALWSQIQLTYETEKVAHYGGAITGPLVQRHPHSGAKILRFAEAVTTKLNPVRLTIRGISGALQTRFLEDMEQRIYSPAYCYKHQWEPGDILIADNHSLIHGRKAFLNDCPRHLRRIQLL